MNMQRTSKLLLILFTGLTTISAVNVYYTHQLPIYETKTTRLCTYQHTGAYNYTAKLVPNMIYNKTTLKPGEGTLYSPIVDYINLNFTYFFSCNPKPTNETINPEIFIQLESPEKWTRTLSDDEARELLQLNGSPNFRIKINETKMQPIIDLIDTETGMRTMSYNINIKPTIHVKADTPTGIIDETYTPEIKITFITGGEKGNYITIENLVQTKPGALTQESRIHLKEVEGQRMDSYAATAIMLSCLAFSTILYLMNRPKTPSIKPITKIIEPYKELITETTQKPPETEKTISYKSLEDLAKTSEILSRPIIHTTIDGEHIFYIIDNSTKYIYKLIN